MFAGRDRREIASLDTEELYDVICKIETMVTEEKTGRAGPD